VETWREFCELLQDAGAVLLRDDLRATDFDHGEGRGWPPAACRVVPVAELG
jgi:hypothetical protein